jgi:hypothetical protein
MIGASRQAFDDSRPIFGASVQTHLPFAVHPERWDGMVAPSGNAGLETPVDVSRVKGTLSC